MSVLTSEPVCCAPVGDRCGEGIVWHPAEQTVYWNDINRFLVHRFDPASQSVRTWFFDEVVAAVLLTSQDNLLAVCLGSRVILWEPESDKRHDFGFNLPGWPAVRLNDAAVDPRGSLWVGSMRNNVNADGSDGEAGGTDGVLFRIHPNGDAAEIQTQIGISNTLVWSPDQTTFYFGDSLANTVWSYNYNSTTGDIQQTGPHLANYLRGQPDGSSIDSEGHLWNCRWGGNCIVRVSPEGEIDHVLELPTRNITNCTFGGENLSTLYITTAASSDRGDRLAGSLFAVQTGVLGLPDNRFRIAT